MNTREEEEQVDQFLIHDLFYWIGLSDLATEGSYVWAESHAVAEYTNWAADQPGGDTSQQEHTCNRCYVWECLRMLHNQQYSWHFNTAQ